MVNHALLLNYRTPTVILPLGAMALGIVRVIMTKILASHITHQQLSISKYKNTLNNSNKGDQISLNFEERIRKYDE